MQYTRASYFWLRYNTRVMDKDSLVLAAHAGAVAAVVVLLAAGGLRAPLTQAHRWTGTKAQSAAVFFIPSVTVTELRDTYSTGQTETKSGGDAKIRILIVPGHQPSKGGTEFKDLRERDMVVDIANDLANMIGSNSHFEVTVARGKSSWNPTFESYFSQYKTAIDDFAARQKELMNMHVADGSMLLTADQVHHNDAPSTAVTQLYGINKWATDHNINITLHLHINDYAGRRPNRAGMYRGFAVYVPDHQYSNAGASRKIGEAIANRLAAFHATSTMPREDAGVVEDQSLIAIGSNNSTDAAALLIEYAYIYEPQFQNAAVRKLAIADYAYQTYLGLQDFFADPPNTSYGSLSFPYDWSTITLNDAGDGPGVYGLQSALRYLGYYPAQGASLVECPISGILGSCTKNAVKAYQRDHGLAATGTLSQKTRALLESDLSNRQVVHCADGGCKNKTNTTGV